MTRVFNVSELFKNMFEAFHRFPTTMILAVFSGAWLFMFSSSFFQISMRFIFYAMILAIPLSYALHTFANQFSVQGFRRVIQIIFPLLLSATFVFLYSKYLTDNLENSFFIRESFLNLFVVFHLLASLANWKLKQDSFWQYNHQMLVQFLYATLVASIVCGGMMLAIVMIDTFFGLDQKIEIYFYKYALSSALVAHVFVFLTSMPNVSQILSRGIEYPKYLRFIIQYVLLPIGSLYFVILSAHLLNSYWVKGILPQGGVAGFIAGIGVIAVLTFLLSYPMDLDSPKSWFRRFLGLLNVWLLALSIVAIFAVIQRIEFGGLTEPRIYLLALSVWVTLICIWRLVGYGYSIKLIPCTLALVLILTGFAGSFSAASLSMHSQKNILQNLLKKNDWSEKDIHAAESISTFLRKRSEVIPEQNLVLETIQRNSSRLSRTLPQIKYNLRETAEFDFSPFKKFTFFGSNTRSNVAFTWRFAGTKIFFTKIKEISQKNECQIELLDRVVNWPKTGWYTKEADKMKFELVCNGEKLGVQFTDLILVYDPSDKTYAIVSFKGYIFY